MSDPTDELERYLAEQADRPFGDTELVSGRTLQRFSIAGEHAAANLLAKASRALDNGDSERARSFVDRAVRLPFDRHEEQQPAAWAAQMALFSLVTNEMERSDAEDGRWLDAAVEVLADADECGRCELRDVLDTIGSEYELARSESTILRSAIAKLPAPAILLERELSPDELADGVMSVLETCRAYGAAVFARAD